MKANNKGFTLVEIMIVVAIIGLLAAIAVPNFVNARTTAQANACVNNLRQIDSAKQQYAIENNVVSTATPTSANITGYIKGGYASVSCPGGGTYTIGALSADPTCSVGGAHAL